MIPFNRYLMVVSRLWRWPLQKLLRWAGVSPQRLWRLGRADELGFWDGYLGSHGMNWPERFAERMDPEAPLQSFLAECLDRLDVEAPRILDVGAGPMTVVGKQYKGKRLDITAVDPLAEGYDRLIRRHKLHPPVRTTPGRAESLDELFEEAAFDLVHASNCIDHSTDPVEAIEQMVRVVKPGGSVVLRHASREAERNSYTGLHQWNFFVEHGAFMVGNASHTENLTRRFEGRAEVELSVGEGGMITAVLRKVVRPSGEAT